MIADGPGLVFVPFHQMRVSKARYARISAVVEASTPYFRVQAAGRYGNVESDFSAAPPPVGFPSDATPTVQQNDGVAFGDGFRDLDGGFQLVQLGVLAQVFEGASIQRGLVTLIIDFME